MPEPFSRLALGIGPGHGNVLQPLIVKAGKLTALAAALLPQQKKIQDSEEKPVRTAQRCRSPGDTGMRPATTVWYALSLYDGIVGQGGRLAGAPYPPLGADHPFHQSGPTAPKRGAGRSAIGVWRRADTRARTTLSHQTVSYDPVLAYRAPASQTPTNDPS